MSNVNVNRSITDQFYRYKMPRLIAKVEGKGNGIKTVIVNMVDIAKALSRPPAYPTKFFGCELGAQTQFNVKEERYIVNGAHDAIKLQDLLDGFIKKFVLCTECDNPETNLHVQHKKQMIVQRCIACGHYCNIDMRHKLTTFILKNPPDADPTTTTPSKKEKGKKGKGRGKDKDAVNGDDRASPEPANDGHTPGNTSRQTSTADSWEDDDDWGEDVSDAAVKQRMEELTDAAKALALSEELEKTLQERLDLFYEYVKTKKAEGMVPSCDKEVLAEAERLDVKDKAPLVLVELLLDDNILQAIKQYRKHFLRFTHENAKAQKYLLGGLEQLINVHKDTLMPKVPHVLKLFYDGDILDEEVLVDWHKKVSKKYVSKEVSKEIHAKAEPFIKWLQEAEEEESESEEEEVEVVYSTTGKVGTQVVKKEEPENDKEEEEEDDFDIDAI